MAKRPDRQTRYECDKVQGEGSYVVLRRLTIGEVEALQKQRTREKWNDFTFGKKVMAARIVTWNWVDDDGNPLPIPCDDAKSMDQITEDESMFLAELQGVDIEEASKN